MAVVQMTNDHLDFAPWRQGGWTPGMPSHIWHVKNFETWRLGPPTTAEQEDGWKESVEWLVNFSETSFSNKGSELMFSVEEVRLGFFLATTNNIPTYTTAARQFAVINTGATAKEFWGPDYGATIEARQFSPFGRHPGEPSSYTYQYRALGAQFTRSIHNISGGGTNSWQTRAQMVIGGPQEQRPVLYLGNPTETVGATVEIYVHSPLMNVADMARGVQAEGSMFGYIWTPDARNAPSGLLRPGGTPAWGT